MMTKAKSAKASIGRLGQKSTWERENESKSLEKERGELDEFSCLDELGEAWT